MTSLFISCTRAVPVLLHVKMKILGFFIRVSECDQKKVWILIQQKEVYISYMAVTDSKLLFTMYTGHQQDHTPIFLKILINSCGRTEFLFPEILIIKEKKNLTGDLPACLNLFLFWCQIFQIIITLDMLELQVFLFLFDHVG